MLALPLLALLACDVVPDELLPREGPCCCAMRDGDGYRYRMRDHQECADDKGRCTGSDPKQCARADREAQQAR